MKKDGKIKYPDGSIAIILHSPSKWVRKVQAAFRKLAQEERRKHQSKNPNPKR